MMQTLLNKSYPQPLNKYKTIFLVSLFIALFLILFQPFGLQRFNHEHKTLLLAGYGLVTFLVLATHMLIIPKIWPSWFADEHWTIKSQIVWLLLIILNIGVGNYIYSTAFHIIQWAGIYGLLIFVLFTLLVAIIPVTAVTIISQNVHLKRNLASSQSINQNLKPDTPKAEPEEINLASGKQIFEKPVSDILYIASEGNYLNVAFTEDGILKTTLIRNTLKTAEDATDDTTLMRCHRAFIVNLKYIKHVTGNSQGYNLSLHHTDTLIPVSRSFTREFKLRLEQL